MIRSIAPALLTSLFFTGNVPQDVPEAPKGISDLDSRLATWRADHGDSWNAVQADLGGYAEFIHGGRIFGESVPGADEEWFALARKFLAEAKPLMGIEGETLTNDVVTFLPLGRVGSTDKWSVRFRQKIQGVPVEGASANVLLDEFGSLLSIQTTAIPDLEVTNLSARVDEQTAVALGELAAQDRGLDIAQVSDPELVFTRSEQGEVVKATLAWKLEVFGRARADIPHARVAVVDDPVVR